MESNHRLPPYKDDALTTELQPHKERPFYIRGSELIDCMMEGWDLLYYPQRGATVSSSMTSYSYLSAHHLALLKIRIPYLAYVLDFSVTFLSDGSYPPNIYFRDSPKPAYAATSEQWTKFTGLRASPYYTGFNANTGVFLSFMSKSTKSAVCTGLS